MDTHLRGQANLAAAVMGFFGTLVAAALLFILLNQAADPLLGMARDGSSLPEGSTGIGYAESGWTWAPFFALVLACVGGLAAAAAVSRRAPR